MPRLEDFHPKLVEYIKAHEGEDLEAYKDSKGIWTIGVGHNLEAGPPPLGSEKLPKDSKGRIDYTGFHVSRRQSDTWLAEDIAKAKADAESTEEWASMNTAARQNALIELVFNMGLGRAPANGRPGRGFLSFVRTRAAMRDQRWPDVAKGLRTSKWYRDVKEYRAERIIKLLETGWYR